MHFVTINFAYIDACQLFESFYMPNFTLWKPAEKKFEVAPGPKKKLITINIMSHLVIIYDHWSLYMKKIIILYIYL